MAPVVAQVSPYEGPNLIAWVTNYRERRCAHTYSSRPKRTRVYARTATMLALHRRCGVDPNDGSCEPCFADRGFGRSAVRIFGGPAERSAFSVSG